MAKRNQDPEQASAAQRQGNNRSNPKVVRILSHATGYSEPANTPVTFSGFRRPGNAALRVELRTLADVEVNYANVAANGTSWTAIINTGNYGGQQLVLIASVAGTDVSDTVFLEISA